MIKNLFLLTIAAFIYAAWQLKGIIFVLTLLLLGGCNAMETTCYYDAYGDHYCTKTYYFESVPRPTHAPPVYVVEEKEPEDTLIYIDNIIYHSNEQDISAYDWSYQCGDTAYFSAPHNHAPWYCYHYDDHHVECHWYMGGGCYEVYSWDDMYCEWDYMYDYCE